MSTNVRDFAMLSIQVFPGGSTVPGVGAAAGKGDTCLSRGVFGGDSRVGDWAYKDGTAWRHCRAGGSRSNEGHR